MIEVVSSSSRVMDRKTRFGLYESRGVRDYWIVDTKERVVEIYRRSDESCKEYTRMGAVSRDDRLGILSLSGFEMDLSRVFRDRTGG